MQKRRQASLVLGLLDGASADVDGTCFEIKNISADIHAQHHGPCREFASNDLLCKILGQELVEASDE